MIRTLTVVSILLSTIAWGQAPAQRLTLIKAGRLFDARTGQMLSNQAILVEGDRIKEVGTAAAVAPHAANARVIDLSSSTVLPGLIDAHNHVLGNPKDLSPVAGLRMSSAQATLWGVRNLRIWLDKGFTTLRDACESDRYYGQIALRNSIQQGLIQGPRMIAAGQCLSLTGGHGDSDQLAVDEELPRRPNIADTIDEVATAARRDIKYGADWIKLMATGGVMDTRSDFRVQELSEAQMAKAVEVAHRANKKVMAHAHGTEGIKAAVRAGVDSIEHGTFIDEQGAKDMKARGTYYVATLMAFSGVKGLLGTGKLAPASEAKAQRTFAVWGKGLNLAYRNGVKIALGTDSAVAPHTDANKELELMVSKGGMTPRDALIAATKGGPDLMNLSSETGTLDPGKSADLIAVEGDPLVDPTAVQRVGYVMVEGRPIPMKGQ